MKIILLLLGFLGLSLPALAKSDYTAQIEVDVEAEDSVKAKDQAMLEAQRKGFIEVASQLTAQENVELLNQLDDDEIAKFVQSVGVADEKSGGTKYKALLTVEINENLLKDYMAENDMINVKASELLVIPVFRSEYSGKVELWERSNQWRQNWLSKGLIKFGALQVRTIDSRFEQIDDLNGENALYMGSPLFEEISRINGSDGIYVVYAETLPNNDLKVTVKNERAKTEDSFTVLAKVGENIFDAAIEKSVMFISNMERSAKKQSGVAESGVISAVYTYQDMKDWISKSNALKTLESVKDIDTKSMGGGKVNFDLHYNGSLDDLFNALPELGLSYENMGNYVIIR